MFVTKNKRIIFSLCVNILGYIDILMKHMYKLESQ